MSTNRFIFMIVASFLVLQCEESDTTSPTISIINPLDRSFLKDSIAIEVLAEDDVGVISVEIFLDDTLVGVIESAPWSFAWMPTGIVYDQEHRLYGKAYDEAGNVGISDTLVVTFLPPHQPHASLTPQTLEFGEFVDEIQITITNVGFDTLQWSFAEVQPWLEVYPISGITVSQIDTVVVVVNRDGLEPGDYSGEIQFNSEGNDQVVPVSMTVAVVPVLWASEDSLEFPVNITSRTFSLKNSGYGNLEWSITSNQDWLQVSPNAGETETETDNIAVSIYRGNLTEGVYHGKIFLHSNGGESEISVRMDVDYTSIADPNTIQVFSDPSGASIYYDGANVNMVTPATITSLQPGPHQIRLFLPGYNEYTAHISHEIDESHRVNITLNEPGFPRPVISFSNPANGNQYTDNIINVSGSIELRDSSGEVMSYLGDHAILSINNYDQALSVTNGGFSQDVSITSGENTLQVRANSPQGNTGQSELVTCVGTFPAPDIEVTLTWNTPTSDLDLHIWTPAGEHCYYGHMRTAEGFLDIDDVEGYGPETFTAQNAVLGGYVLMVNSWSLDQDAYADASLQMRLNGSPIYTYGPHSFTIADQNGSNPEAWWEVVVFHPNADSSPGQSTSIPEALQQKIISDMQNLPAKH